MQNFGNFNFQFRSPPPVFSKYRKSTAVHFQFSFRRRSSSRHIALFGRCWAVCWMNASQDMASSPLFVDSTSAADDKTPSTPAAEPPREPQPPSQRYQVPENVAVLVGQSERECCESSSDEEAEAQPSTSRTPVRRRLAPAAPSCTGG